MASYNIQRKTLPRTNPPMFRNNPHVSKQPLYSLQLKHPTPEYLKSYTSQQSFLIPQWCDSQQCMAIEAAETKRLSACSGYRANRLPTISANKLLVPSFAPVRFFLPTLLSVLSFLIMFARAAVQLCKPFLSSLPCALPVQSC